VAKQTAQALRNVMAVLDAAGASEADIISVRVFLTDTDHFEEMNEVYATFFSKPRPARTTVYVGLPAGLLVEIDVLAVMAEG
jgi:2-iminobutanoate/2-iminopropanoate deaminase